MGHLTPVISKKSLTELTKSLRHRQSNMHFEPVVWQVLPAKRVYSEETDESFNFRGWEFRNASIKLGD